jgi:hypothetical protein
MGDLQHITASGASNHSVILLCVSGEMMVAKMIPPSKCDMLAHIVRAKMTWGRGAQTNNENATLVDCFIVKSNYVTTNRNPKPQPKPPTTQPKSCAPLMARGVACYWLWGASGCGFFINTLSDWHHELAYQLLCSRSAVFVNGTASCL